MRVMVMVKASPESEAGLMPGRKLLEDMGAYNEALAKAGVLEAGEGLHPSSKGVRVRFRSDGGRLVPGPFPATGELLAGFWLWKVRDMDEAVAWIRRMPRAEGMEQDIEIRPVFEAEDFGEAMTPELKAKEDELRARLESRAGTAGT